MLPPKPAPMMRAPRQPSRAHALSTMASTAGVETSKSSRRLLCDSLSSSPMRAKSRCFSASTNACTRAISESTCLRRLGCPDSASRRRWLYGVSASDRCSPESMTAIATSSGKGTTWYSRVPQSSSSALPRRPRADANWSITPTCTPVACCSARWHITAASLPSMSGRRPAATATRSAADELMPAAGGTSEATCTAWAPTPSSAPTACTYFSPP